MTERLHILILDDEPKMGRILGRVLEREGHSTQSTTSPKEALDWLGEQRFDLLLTDLKMPEMTGVDVMTRAREIDSELDAIMMTAYATVETAVDAMKAGAIDYLIKPFRNEELLLLVARVAAERSLQQENRSLKATLSRPPEEIPAVVAKSAAMQEVLTRVRKVGATDVSVLLLGESGTGKEVLATQIHAIGPRRDRAFVKVNCGALPENLLESELFGHVRGAFTGAVETRKGLFNAADGGTIFLDEIGEISQALQVKLLRVLQSGEFQRVGDPQTFKVNVRVLAATNRSLEDLVELGEFRSDLYYRLNVVPINIPPLRERLDDVPPLIDHFLEMFKERMPSVKPLSPEAFNALLGYDWPGNIRELENALEHAMVLCDDDTIGVEDLPHAIQNYGTRSADDSVSDTSTGGRTLEEVERNLLLEALQETHFNHTRAAKKLGITRRTLGYRIEKYGLPRKAEAEDDSTNGGQE